MIPTSNPLSGPLQGQQRHQVYGGTCGSEAAVDVCHLLRHNAPNLCPRSSATQVRPGSMVDGFKQAAESNRAAKRPRKNPEAPIRPRIYPANPLLHG